MAERKDYSGEFDPGFRYEDLSKEALVRLCREYALTAHILDRSGMAAVGLRYGQAAVEETRGGSGRRGGSGVTMPRHERNLP